MRKFMRIFFTFCSFLECFPLSTVGSFSPSEEVYLNDDPPLHNSKLLSQFSSLLRDWENTADSLLAINPADGSLLMFLVESLDSALGSNFKQSQISFSSCIPNVFPSADAHSLLQNLILYRLPGKLNIQMSNVSDQSGIYAHGRSTKTSLLGQASPSISLVSVETGAHPPVAMITTHKDGSMNQWQVDFADNTAFSTLISLSHLTRLSGHRFPLTGMFPHPTLPLLLSVSTFTAKGENVEDGLDSNVGSDTEGDRNREGNDQFVNGCPLKNNAEPTENQSNGFTFSELILWKCDSVFPLSQTGGIMELAKLTSTSPDAFDKIAWLPKLFIHPLLTFDSAVALSPKSVSPCACFIASNDCGLRFYQVVLDGRALLDFLSGKQNYRRILERFHSFDSEEREGYTVSYPAVSTVNHLLHCIVSDQSGPKPGSVLKLCRLKSSTNVLRNPLFLHVFSEHVIAEGRLPCGTKCSPDELVEDNFYLVALDNTVAPVDSETGLSLPGGKTRTMIHMWRIEITTSNSDESGSTGDSPFSPRNPQVAPSFTDLHEYFKCGIRSYKVVTSYLDLPDNVHVTIATASTNTLSAVSENRACSVPFLISTTCSDGVVRFWSCQVRESSESSSKWSYCWIEGDIKRPVSSMGPNRLTGIDGVPVSMDCANTGRIAVVVLQGSANVLQQIQPSRLMFCVLKI